MRLERTTRHEKGENEDGRVNAKRSVIHWCHEPEGESNPGAGRHHRLSLSEGDPAPN